MIKYYKWFRVENFGSLIDQNWPSIVCTAYLKRYTSSLAYLEQMKYRRFFPLRQRRDGLLDFRCLSAALARPSGLLITCFNYPSGSAPHIQVTGNIAAAEDGHMRSAVSLSKKGLWVEFRFLVSARKLLSTDPSWWRPRVWSYPPGEISRGDVGGTFADPIHGMGDGFLVSWNMAFPCRHS